jgi:N-hydroxyarylamine O-acetyltransferase
MAWFHGTSPRSPFAHGPTCSRATPGGRVTIAGDRLIETTGAEHTEHVLDGDDAILAAYREHFGFTIDRAPT